MRVNISISKPEQQRLHQYMMVQIGDQMQFRLELHRDHLRNTILNYIISEFYESEAVQSLITPFDKSLKGDLGLDNNIRSNLDTILRTILGNIKIDGPQYKVLSKAIRFWYIWRILPVGYNDLLGLKESFYYSVGGSNKRPWSGKYIPWLEWLLKGCPGVQGYISAFGNFNESRSGIALMWRAKGRTWNITADPDIVGGLNDNDNFLTKIFANVNKVIAQEVEIVLNA